MYRYSLKERLGALALLFGSAHAGASGVVVTIQTIDALYTQEQHDGTAINDLIACFNGTLTFDTPRARYDIARRAAVDTCQGIRNMIG